MKLLAEALITKWGTDFVPVRDSWCENSDYDRSQKLVHDVVQWVAIQRNKLGDSQKMAELEAIEAQCWDAVEAEEDAYWAQVADQMERDK